MVTNNIPNSLFLEKVYIIDTLYEETIQKFIL